ncbi:MAG TPA: GerMN domain-containing protein [Actinomycetota bacterium]|nr:GerMN domain-containing protein [Actinomycetota bacterium]
MRGGAVLAVAIALTACGQPEVTIVPEGELPPDLYASPAATPSTVATPQLPESGRVYMVRKGKLRAVERPLPGGGVATSLPAALLLALFQAPPGERLDTAIPPNTRLISVTVDDTTARVDLSSEFEHGATGEELQLRVAQVVFTVTEDQRISSVAISIDGEPRTVPSPRGVLLARPVSRDDYAAFGPTG